MVIKLDLGDTLPLIRKLGAENRVCIPKEIVNIYNLKGDTVKFYTLKNGVYIEFDEVTKNGY